MLGRHNLKSGIFMEHTLRPATRASSFNGTFSFNARQPEPVQHQLRVRQRADRRGHQYTESNASPRANGRFTNVEFFVQDNWRLAPRFTFDGGVRFYYIGPTMSKGQQVANFDPSQWNASSAPQLYQPAIVNGVARGAEPGEREHAQRRVHRPHRARHRQRDQRHGRDRREDRPSSAVPACASRRIRVGRRR